MKEIWPDIASILNKRIQNLLEIPKSYQSPPIYLGKNLSSNELASLNLFHKSNKDTCYLVVPPLINKPDILNLNNRSFLEELSNIQSIYITNWSQPSSLGLNEHINCCIEHIQKLLQKYKTVHVIGYCMGGHIAMLAGTKVNCIVSTIATPFSFSENKWQTFSKTIKSIANNKYISKEVLQIMFYLSNFSNTNDFYCNTKNLDKEIENWLDNTTDVSRQLLIDLAKNFIEDNTWQQNCIKINGVEYNLSDIHMHKLIYGSKDSVVNTTCVNPKWEKYNYIIDAGHVGLITSKASQVAMELRRESV